MKLKILAVTACPTGIAHTFMAAEKLELVATSKNCDIKVETNGAAGVENELTSKEIFEADYIIIAADKAVETDRFNGKKVLVTSVSKAIKDSDRLIQTCIDDKVPYFEVEKQQTQVSVDQENYAHQIYKHLMSGVSQMLPFVVAGGILIAISFLFGIYSADPTSEQYNVLAATINTIGATSMGLMVPIFAGYISYSIANRPGLVAGLVSGMLANNTGSGFLGAILAGFAAGYFCKFLLKSLKNFPKELEGVKSILIIPVVSVFTIGLLIMLTAPLISGINNSMMNFLNGLQDANPVILGLVIGIMVASDFGGPINKAAYVTGTMLLAEGNFYFMAGVSAACITPPLICAFATTIFKKEFNDDERAVGIVNYVLGATHITEGAIPFVAKDPIRLIPIMMFGSSISAIITYLMKIQVPAPHGGFLILPLVSSPFLWVLAIFIGSLSGAVLMGLHKRNLNKKEAKNT